MSEGMANCPRKLELIGSWSGDCGGMVGWWHFGGVRIVDGDFNQTS